MVRSQLSSSEYGDVAGGVSLRGEKEPGTHRGGLFEWSALVVFAALLAAVSLRHEMFRDEMQAFLIARDSHSLRELFQNLRYEGHPALWHLLLYIPAHLSWNPASMQAINYVFAVAEALLILSARRLHWVFRLLATFSFCVFYGYGTVARNYMLAMLLLTAAARCFTGERRRGKWAILCLALAINTHFFAIPVAAIIAIWGFGFAKLDRLGEWRKLLKDAEFWTAAMVLMVSVAIAYFTIRPPADIYTPQYGKEHLSFLHYFWLTEGRAWQVFLPIPAVYIPANLVEMLVPKHNPSLLAVIVSLAIFAVITASLRTYQARRFFIATSLVELAALAATVRVPPVRHFGLIFACYLIALLIDAYKKPGAASKAWIPVRSTFALVFIILSVQTLAAISASASDVIHPFSEAKETAQWLIHGNFDKNVMVVEPGNTAAGVVGYLERPTMYFPACQCFSSFTVWKSSWDMERKVTAQELDSLNHSSHLPVIVISNSQFDDSTLRELKLLQIQAFDHKPIYANEHFFVYEQATP